MIILYYKSDKQLKITDPNQAIDFIYYLEASIPTKKQIKNIDAYTTDPKIIEYFIKYPKTGITKIKKELSIINNKIPLYDVFSKNLYLIGKFNVYPRVIHQHYRFPTKYFYQKLLQEYQTKKDQNITDVLEKRKFRKLLLMIKFLRSFDLDLLEKTYVTVFYFYANEVGKNITTCQRPSFLPHFTHITPYYTRSEVINLALNMGIKLEDRYYDTTDINKLCDIISTNDISAKILLDHQQYIINQKCVGLVQYYTLQGAYFVNQYLRRMISYDYKNEFLENIITAMWDLTNKAPAFDKPYTLYRFISNDNYLRHLQIGDMYTEPGFTSATRDPFYRSDLYKFGFILVKIHVPNNIPGVAICIETISHFPMEQEILLGPLSVLRLDSKDEKISYYHTDEKFKSQVKTRYEFTYIDRKPINFVSRPLYQKTQKINFLRIETSNAITLEEKIRFFINKYANPMFQFISTIGNHDYTIVTERYDSTGAYKNFYAITTQNGFSMYTIKNNYVLFMVELGEILDKKIMHVNYYVRHSMIEKDFQDQEFILFVSGVAYYFGIDQVVIWADYQSCVIAEQKGGDLSTRQRNFGNKIYQPEPVDKFKTVNVIENKIMGGTYCIDFYQYLKSNVRKYKTILHLELQPKFSYYALDKLRTVGKDAILRKDDQDEIYQIYDKIYQNTSNPNLADFYVWMADHHCYLMEILVFKMERFFRIDNPFHSDYYILDPLMYLYNRKYIDTFPQKIARASEVIFKDSKTIMPKNDYRLAKIR